MYVAVSAFVLELRVAVGYGPETVWLVRPSGGPSVGLLLWSTPDGAGGDSPRLPLIASERCLSEKHRSGCIIGLLSKIIIVKMRQ